MKNGGSYIYKYIYNIGHTKNRAKKTLQTLQE